MPKQKSYAGRSRLTTTGSSASRYDNALISKALKGKFRLPYRVVM
jgi:hypothetical protein